MRHFKDGSGQIRAIDEDQEHLIGGDWTEVSDSELGGELDLIKPTPTARQVRDAALAALTHDFGDGRVMQTRPKDESNIRNATEVMEANSIPTIGWVTADDRKHDVTVAELKTALAAGQLAAMQIWGEYDPEA